MSVCYYRKDGTPTMECEIKNVSSPTPIQRAALKFNENYLKIAPGAMAIPTPITQGKSCTIIVPLSQTGLYNAAKVDVQMAMRTDAGVVYFTDRIPIDIIFADDGKLTRDHYLKLWKDESLQKIEKVKALPGAKPDAMIAKLEQHRIFFVAKRTGKTSVVLYFSAKVGNLVLMLETTIASQGIKCVGKSQDKTSAQGLIHRVLELL